MSQNSFFKNPTFIGNQNLKASINSPNFTGKPTVPTPDIINLDELNQDDQTNILNEIANVDFVMKYFDKYFKICKDLYPFYL